MRDILADLFHWREEGKSIALATVIETWGSSPRKVGSKMGLTLDANITGSVSGGCIENAVVEAGMEVLRSNQPQLLHFGVADETAWEVGLACGGSIAVFVKPLNNAIFESLNDVLANDKQAALVTVLRGDESIVGKELILDDNGNITGSIGNEWDEKVFPIMQDSLIQGISRRVELNESIEIFLEVILPPLTIVIVGGAHISIALASLAKTLGYRTVIIDPRKVWGNEERFPNVDKLIQSWIPDAFEKIAVTSSTAIAMLTHDPKLDDPALKIALNSSAFYVGALGSKTTNAKRRERLLNDGMTESQFSRLHAPVGLKIGAQSPEEIALSIMAEVVDAYRKQNQISVKREADLYPIKG
ncbi:MAG TPA: XdhC family protein [Anaerolineales bacterium]|nr:XdhC family protein [Anaerolineales bacterium]